MNLNAIPILGWALAIVFNVSAAIPFWLCWTYFGIGTKYATFLPTEFQSIPFWDCVGLAFSIEILKAVLIPKLASVSQEVKAK